MADQYDVFISYARSDYKDENNNLVPNNVVSKIIAAFKKNGITFWIDEDGILTGDNFAPTIAAAIKSAKVFVFVSTENSNKSYWTQNEISVAYSYKKPILPIICDDSTYPESVIMYLAWLEYCDYNHLGDQAIDKLVESVNKYIPKVHKRKITLVDICKQVDNLDVKLSRLSVILEQMQATIVAQRQEQQLTNQLLGQLLKQLPKQLPKQQIQHVAHVKSIPPAVKQTNKIANVFIVVDLSGTRINAINACMRNVVRYFSQLISEQSTTLFKLAVLGYGSNANWQYPYPQEMASYRWRDFKSSKGCDLGLALAKLNEAMSSYGPQSFFDVHEQYKWPFVLFVSTGKPTDKWSSMQKSLESNANYQMAEKVTICVGKAKELQTIKVGTLYEVTNANDLLATINQCVSKYVMEIINTPD